MESLYFLSRSNIGQRLHLLLSFFLYFSQHDDLQFSAILWILRSAFSFFFFGLCFSLLLKMSVFQVNCS